MSHDIYGCNNVREEIAYVRFTMNDPMAFEFYKLFDALDYYAGVSGCGGSATIPLQQVEKALAKYNSLLNNDPYFQSDNEFLTWQRNEILKFINSCLESARKDGNVVVYFA